MIEFDGTDVAVITRLRKKSDVITENLIAKTDELTQKLVERIVDKLTVIAPKSRGNFESSVAAIPAFKEGNYIVGGVTATPGEYYTIVPVEKKVLRFLLDGKEVFTKMVNHPPLAKERFVRSSLADMQDEIEFELKEALLLSSL